MRFQGLRRSTPSIALAIACGMVLSVSTASASHCGGDHSHDTMKKVQHTKQQDIIDTAVSAGDFGTLVAAVKAAGLVEALRGDGPFTVFAPTDAAFAALPEGTLDDLLKPENRDKLVSILKYHVVSGRVYSKQALEAGQATTLQKGKIKIRSKESTALVNEAKLLTTDIEATNGVIHVIDQVLIPTDRMAQSK